MIQTDRRRPAANGAPPEIDDHHHVSHTITGEGIAHSRLATVDEATLGRLSRQLTRAARHAACLPPSAEIERVVYLAARVRLELRRRRARHGVADALAEADQVIGGDAR